MRLTCLYLILGRATFVTSTSSDGSAAPAHNASGVTGVGVCNPTMADASLSAMVRYHCDGPRFGHDLNTGSCLQAWTSMPILTQQLSFGDREDDDAYDVGLPKRYLSRTHMDISLPC